MANIAKIENMTIGNGGLTSARRGAIIVKSLANRVQIPKAVDLNITGNNALFARYATVKVALTPNFEHKIVVAIITLFFVGRVT